MTTPSPEPANSNRPTYECSGSSFFMSPTGIATLGKNVDGEGSSMVLIEVTLDWDPPFAVVSPSFVGDEATGDLDDFMLNEPKHYPGMGTVTLIGVEEPGFAEFCFEPDAGFTVDPDLSQ